MKNKTYLIAALLLSACAVGERGQWSYMSNYIRSTEPILTAEVDRTPNEIALCLSGYLSGPGSVRIERQQDTTYVTHFPFYRGLEDYEISIDPVAESDRLQIQMRHHATTTRHAAIAETVRNEADRAYAALNSCAPEARLSTVSVWRDDGQYVGAGRPEPIGSNPASRRN